VPVRELLDTDTVPLPSASSLGGLATTRGGDEDADYDPVALYAHIAGAVQARVSAALVREAVAAVPDRGGVRGEIEREFDDPALSDAEYGDESARTAGSAAARDAAARAAAARAAATARERRSFVARVMARVLEAHPLGPIERDLVAAAEGADKRRQRRLEELAPPTLLDALFAVQRLRAPARAPLAPPPGADAAAERAYAAAAAAHAARTGAAAGRVAAAVEADADGAGARLAAVVGLSDRLLGGATWSAAGALPAGRAARRAVLLWELKRVYGAELARAGLRPDATTVNVVLSALCAAGDARGAYAFLERDFPAARVTPDARTFRALVRLHAAVERRADAAAAAVRAADAAGVAPDAECLGLLAHAYAREWRLDEARAVVRRARDAGLRLSDTFVRLLRARAKALGQFHDDIPEHPAGWQFSPAAMAKRMGGAKSKKVRREWTQGMRPKRYGFT
jgi:hypothetical protein